MRCARALRWCPGRRTSKRGTHRNPRQYVGVENRMARSLSVPVGDSLVWVSENCDGRGGRDHNLSQLHRVTPKWCRRISGIRRRRRV